MVSHWLSWLFSVSTSAWIAACTSGLCDRAVRSPDRPFSSANFCSASGSSEISAVA